MSVTTSLRLLHLEKLLILSKEVNFIENILHYYAGELNIDKDVISKKNIKRLLKDIDSIKRVIKEVKDVNDKYQQKGVNFIIYFDYVRTQIEEVLKVIDSLYTKMNQLFGEMLNQYLPYPTFFGRRFSSNGLMMFLDNYYQYLSTLLLKNRDNAIILGWSYNTNPN